MFARFLRLSALLALTSVSAPSAAQERSERELLLVQDIVELGFERSRVVMMNEAHSGVTRSVRTRMVGLSILPRAHAAGARYLAAEVLTPDFAAEANATRRLPPGGEGLSAYLSQPDMRVFLQAALDLGWTLIAYEADISEMPAFTSPLDRENWRDRSQAERLVAALNELDDDAKILVWSGNSHLDKEGGDFPGMGRYSPMGEQFIELAGFAAFAIDQASTVDFEGDGRRAEAWIAMYGDELEEAPLQTLGFLVEAQGVDARVISLDNRVR